MQEKSKHFQTVAQESAQLAGIMSRFLAFFIDGIAIALVLTALLFALSLAFGTFDGPLLQFIGLALPVVYHWYFWTRRDGQSPGKSVVGIRVVKKDGAELSDTDAFIRAIGYQVSALVCGLGYIWAIFDGNNQTWHDKLAGTYVVSADSTRKAGQISS